MRSQRVAVIAGCSKYEALVVRERHLPLPWVLYPGVFGAFLAFRDRLDSKSHFCACTYIPIQNFIRLRLRDSRPKTGSPLTNFILDDGHFPSAVVEQLLNSSAKQDETVINHLSFSERLCHECNRIAPSVCYCEPMYGSQFMQTHGWYVNKCALEFGILLESPWLGFLEDSCPQDVMDILNMHIPGEEALYDKVQNHNFKEINRINSLILKRQRRIHRFVENEVRDRFRYRRIGERWLNETHLFYLLRRIFSDQQVIHHHRPDFLRGLEIDIFVPHLRAGIEYQGIQHFEPLSHWGGEDALAKLQERDRRKAELCEQNGVKLLYFRYDEQLDFDTVKTRVAAAIGA